MKPIDITNYSSGWDCVLSPLDLSAYHRAQSQRVPAMTYKKYVFPVAVGIAITGALLSSEILIALAVILAVASGAGKIYSMLTTRSHQHDIKLNTDSIIYRHEIEHSANTEALFTRAIDAAVELKEIVAGNSWMENFANAELINASLWQCACAVRSGSTHDDHLYAQEIISTLEQARDYGIQSIEALESQEELEEVDIATPLAPVDNHALTISENMRALRDGTLHLNDKMRALHDDSARIEMTEKSKEE